MKWRRSMGSTDRRATYAARRADAWYCRPVKPAGLAVTPSCSIPIESTFVRQLPACHAMSDWCTSWMIRPRRETMKCADACERWFRSQVIDPQNDPSVTCTTIRRSEEHTSELQSRQYLVCR